MKQQIQDRHAEITEAMAEAVRETFEVMTFSEIIPISSCQLEASHYFESEVEVSRPFRARFILKIDCALAKSISQTLFGLADEISEDVVMDTLSELCNTATGRLVSKLVAPNQSFDLRIPLTRRMDHTGAAHRKIDFGQNFAIDESSISVTWTYL